MTVVFDPAEPCAICGGAPVALCTRPVPEHGLTVWQACADCQTEQRIPAELQALLDSLPEEAPPQAFRWKG